MSRQRRQTIPDDDDVLKRLTDPKNYTGAHKSRFDTKTGRGKGLQGRDMGNEAQVSDLSQITRSNLHKKKPRKPRRTTGIDLSNVQKFGTQAKKAPNVWVYNNGDVSCQGAKIVVNKAINSWERFLNKCTTTCKLPTGPVRKVYEVIQQEEGNLHKRVTKLEALKDGAIYLCCGAEPISKNKYPSILLEPLEEEEEEEDM